jgi:Tol biopolymer transport system component
VLFHLPRDSASSTKLDVWSVPVDGGKAELVLRNASFPVPFPDGETIAFVPGASGFTGTRIALVDSEGSPRTLVQANDAIWWPAVSPDGSRIAYVDGGTSVYVAEVSTGESTKVAEIAGVSGAAEWLDDDTVIVSSEG